MKGEIQHNEFESRKADMAGTALILVGGYGTRLRPLVCPPLSPGNWEFWWHRNHCCMWRLIQSLDSHPPETSGRIRQSTDDPTSGRGVGRSRRHRYRPRRQLPPRDHVSSSEEGAYGLYITASSASKRIPSIPPDSPDKP